MTVYKWLSLNKSVQRFADGACIPNDPANADWQAFQKWLAAGNVPQDADPIELVALPSKTVEERLNEIEIKLNDITTLVKV